METVEVKGHPVVRSWLHLHDDDPEVARVRSRYPGVTTEDLVVVAFRLRDGTSRPRAKVELVRQLSSAGLLADSYVGEPPTDLTQPGDPREEVALVVEDLGRRRRPGGPGGGGIDGEPLLRPR